MALTFIDFFGPSGLFGGLNFHCLCQVQEFGLSEIRDLIPNGRHIAVTEENKKEYVKLVCQMKMTGAIRKQIDSFLEGFYEIIPKRLISIFDEQELELLISGLPNIDLDDLKANTEYHKYTENSLQVSQVNLLFSLENRQYRNGGGGGRGEGWNFPYIL